MDKQHALGIYIHWPFCLAKCPYCDFNVHIREEIDQDIWLKSYQTSLEYYAQRLPEQAVISVFFGGGTPSLMKPETVRGVLESVKGLWGLEPDAEITMEANPTSTEREKFQGFRDAGVNRISLGVQALNDRDLTFLGRKHNRDEAIAAIQTAQDIFGRSSFDLIYARPDQTLEAWEVELKEAADLAQGHLSLYQLTIERNTPFYFDQAQGKFQIPQQDLAADFYTLTQEVLEGAGLPAYEVSNHASAGQESRHNLIYWRYQDYIGIGPGAHGRFTEGGQKFASRDHPAPEIWLNFVKERGHGSHPFEPLPEKGQAMEALMMGLRLREGLKLKGLEPYLDPKKIQEMEGQGWLTYDEDRIVLNREGWLRLNAIAAHILN